MKTIGADLQALSISRHGWFKNNTFVSILLFFLLLAVGCKQTPSDSYKMVKAYGNGSITNVTKSFIYYSNGCSLVSPGAFMASDGDLLDIAGWTILYEGKNYAKGQPIRFIASDSLLIINNKVAGLCIDSQYNMERILAQIDSASILHLQVLNIAANGMATYGRHLQRIAAINADVSIYFDDSISNSDLSKLLLLFNPPSLFGTLRTSQLAMLQSEQQLANLFISVYDEPNFFDKPLPALQNLKTLSLHYKAEKPLEMAAFFLRNNPQIERMAVINFDSALVSGLLQPLSQLKELIWTGNNIKQADIAAHTATLERLLVDSNEWQIQMPHLRWATVFNSPNNTMLLDSMAQKSPQLEVLEIFADGSSMDLKSLPLLKHLRALILVDADSLDLRYVKQMKQLELLSISTDTGNEDSIRAVLQASLPHTLVVPNDGFCVGSGWLLLLLPAMMIAVWWAHATPFKKKATT